MFKVLGTATVFALSAFGALTAPAAHAAFVSDNEVKIDGGKADFGRGAHLLSAPTGAGSVVWSHEPVDGTLVVRAQVTGLLYMDSLDPGCARIVVKFRDKDNEVIRRRSKEVCGEGGNANDADNKTGVNFAFANQALHNVLIETFEVLASGELRAGGSRVITGRESIRFGVKINAGTADFGETPHVGGAPTANGSITFKRESGTVRATVSGRLFWDALLSAGTARLTVFYLDEDGNVLHTQQQNAQGPGGNANAGANHETVSKTWANPALHGVRVRVGTLLHDGSIVNAQSKTREFEEID